MLTVWKYPIPNDREFEISMPRGARPLSVQRQGKKDVLWALVETNEPLVRHAFFGSWTGECAPHERHARFVGTIQRKGLVTHFFDMGERP